MLKFSEFIIGTSHVFFMSHLKLRRAILFYFLVIQSRGPWDPSESPPHTHKNTVHSNGTEPAHMGRKPAHIGRKARTRGIGRGGVPVVQTLAKLVY